MQSVLDPGKLGSVNVGKAARCVSRSYWTRGTEAEMMSVLSVVRIVIAYFVEKMREKAKDAESSITLQLRAEPSITFSLPVAF